MFALSVLVGLAETAVTASATTRLNIEDILRTCFIIRPPSGFNQAAVSDRLHRLRMQPWMQADLPLAGSVASHSSQQRTSLLTYIGEKGRENGRSREDFFPPFWSLSREQQNHHLEAPRSPGTAGIRLILGHRPAAAPKAASRNLPLSESFDVHLIQVSHRIQGGPIQMSIKCLRRASVFGLLLLAQSLTAAAQARVEKNVIYGMYSGTALLLDVHYPARQNGFGIVFIPGSGWSAPLSYSATPLKESPQVAMYVPSLTEAGYTVFAITHRATPTFRYPAAVEDVQRAVRFVRHHAAKFGINPARIGGSGGSSGGHLVSLLGTMDGAGDPNDPDPVNRESAKLQCAVGRAAPADLSQMSPSNGTAAVSLFLGVAANQPMQKNSTEYKTAWAASPINYVSRTTPRFCSSTEMRI